MGTFAAMQTRIITELHRDDINTGSPTPCQDAINSAANHYMRFRFWFNETSSTAPTVDGTATYAWPTTMVQLDAMTITVNSVVTPLRQISPREIDAMYTGTSAKSVPLYWANYQQLFRLYPTPNGVYTLTYYFLKNYAALTGTDSNVWTTEAEELIRARAKKILAGQFGAQSPGYASLTEQLAAYQAHENDVLAGLQRQTNVSTATGRARAWSV